MIFETLRQIARNDDTRTPQKFFSIVSHQKQRKKSAFQILAVDICGRMWYDNRAKPTS